MAETAGAAAAQQKRSISVSIDLDELLRVCKTVAVAIAGVSLLALVYYYYETLALYCFRPGVLIFLLVNAGVLVIALSSGVIVRGGNPSKSSVVEDSLMASVLGENDAFSGHGGGGEEADIRQEERQKEKYKVKEPEKEVVGEREKEKYKAKEPGKPMEQREKNKNKVKEPAKEAEEEREKNKNKVKEPAEEAEEEREKEKVEKEEREIDEKEEMLQVKAFPSFERARSFTTRLFRSSSETISMKPPKAPPTVQIRRRAEVSGSQTEDVLRMQKAASVAGDKVTGEKVSGGTVVKDVDKAADDFISRFYQQMKLQRLDSILRYKNPTD